jgi:SAM-dependent methyltransferase
MREQASEHPNVEWVDGDAARLPLASASVDAVIAMLAIHHFGDLGAALREMMRVRRGGPIVLFTFDPTAHEGFWLYHYFPALRREALLHYPSGQRLRDVLRESGCARVSLTACPLHRALQDRFAASGWGTPEAYLDPLVRKNMSPFALMSPAELDEGLARLHADLKAGSWDSQFGMLRRQAELDVGYIFVRAESM